MATRNRHTVDDHPFHAIWQGYRYGAAYGPAILSQCPAYHRKSIDDTVTPGFFATCRRGGMLPINSVLIQETEQIAKPASGKMIDPYEIGYYYEGDYFRRLDLAHQLQAQEKTPVGLVDSLLSSAIVKARDIPWDALTFAAEASKTARSLRRPLDGVIKVANSVCDKLVRRRLKPPRRPNADRETRYTQFRNIQDMNIVQSFASLWLEMRYAWRPMMFDAEDILAEFNDKVKQLVPIINRGKEFTGLSQDATVVSSFYEAPTTGTFDVKTVRSGLKRCTGSAYVRAMPDAVNSHASFDPVSTAWELVPFSFVVDWFVPIGTWLQGFMPRAGQTVEGHCYSEALESMLVTTYTARGDGTWPWQGTDQEIITKYRWYIRQPMSSPFTPGFRRNLNEFKILDLAALATRGKVKIAKRLLNIT